MELNAAQLPPQVLKLKTHAISDSSRAAAHASVLQVLGGGSSNSGGGGNAPQKRGAADEQPVMAPASARDRFTQHSLKKMGMRGAWGTGTAEKRNISKYG